MRLARLAGDKELLPYLPTSVRRRVGRRGRVFNQTCRDQDLLEAILLAIVQDRAHRDDERVVAERSYPVRQVRDRLRESARPNLPSKSSVICGEAVRSRWLSWLTIIY